MTRAVGPYTPVVRAGSWLICSGQVGLDGGGSANAITLAGTLTTTSGAATAVQIVDAGATTLGNVNAASGTLVLGTAALPLGALVEVEAWARVAE